MEWSERIRLWNHVPVKVLDVRHVIMQPGEKLQSYTLPSSAFVFTNQGEAKVMLDEYGSASGNHQVVHGGKGAVLHICCLSSTFDYYLILYKPCPGSPFTDLAGASTIRSSSPMSSKGAIPG